MQTTQQKCRNGLGSSWMLTRSLSTLPYLFPFVWRQSLRLYLRSSVFVEQTPRWLHWASHREKRIGIPERRAQTTHWHSPPEFLLEAPSSRTLVFSFPGQKVLCSDLLVLVFFFFKWESQQQKKKLMVNHRGSKGQDLKHRECCSCESSIVAKNLLSLLFIAARVQDEVIGHGA